MAISSIGVGSGLPLDELLSDLRKSENQALTLIQSRQVQAENRLSAYGILKGALSSLNTAADTLGKADSYGAVKTAVTGDAFKASATSAAIPGEYSIEVTQLATSQTLVTTGVADRSASNGTGGIITLTLANGETRELDLSEAGTSLDAIVKAVNADKELGIRATLINDGDPDKPHRLLFTATDTGTEASIAKIEVSGNSGSLADLLSFDSAAPAGGQSIQQQIAKDAHVLINGIEIKSASNTLEGAIEGVTLTLDSVTTTPSRLSVSSDDSTTAKAVKDFVKAYNTLLENIGSLTSFDIENGKSAALTGDSLARRLQSDVRNAINVVGSEGDLRTLSQLGITTNVKTGALEIDETKLNQALKDHMPQVQALLSGSNGVSGRINQVSENFTRTGGLISTTTDSITRNIADIKRQYEVTSDRIDAKMENYRRQFSQLDAMVAQMGSISDYLTQQLSMLGNMNSNGK